MSRAFEPVILVFCCNWCSYAGADLAGVMRLRIPPNVRIVRVMCSGRVDPLHVLQALSLGADGVAVNGCHPGDCHYLRGNVLARQRMDFLTDVLNHLGLQGRLEMNYISAGEGSRFQELMGDFTERVRALGPSPLRTKRGQQAAASKREALLELLDEVRTALGTDIDPELSYGPDDVIDGFGQPIYDLEACMGCGACAACCPKDNIELSDADGRRQIQYFHATCVACGTCEDVCPNEAISVRKCLNLRDFLNRKRLAGPALELATCAQCGQPFAPVRQLICLCGEERDQANQANRADQPRPATPDLCSSCRRATGATRLRRAAGLR